LKFSLVFANRKRKVPGELQLEIRLEDRFQGVAGGDTIWANMYDAYEGLSAGMRRMLDPLLAIDPIFQSVPEAGRPLLVADLDLEQGIEGVALGYRWDMVLRGPRATPMGI
jgi:alpha-ketoglutarate-dependent taurine dioxygenase